MNPFLHNLTFRKTDPMASEFYLKDHPTIYRFRKLTGPCTQALS
jgi:hypothetical protein